MRLVLHACGVGGAAYRSSTITEQWWPLEERDVSEEDAAYLLRTFPECFAVVQPARPSVPPAVTRPATGVDRMERAPKAKAKAPSKRK
jgi:hypothetical protein